MIAPGISLSNFCPSYWIGGWRELLRWKRIKLNLTWEFHFKPSFLERVICYFPCDWQKLKQRSSSHQTSPPCLLNEDNLWQEADCFQGQLLNILGEKWRKESVGRKVIRWEDLQRNHYVWNTSGVRWTHREKLSTPGLLKEADTVGLHILSSQLGRKKQITV